MQAQSEPDGVSSQKEAQRLAFYLFWNVRGSYDRSATPAPEGNVFHSAETDACYLLMVRPAHGLQPYFAHAGNIYC